MYVHRYLQICLTFMYIHTYIHAPPVVLIFLSYYVTTYNYVCMYLLIIGIPGVVPAIRIDIKSMGNIVTLTLSWGEPFNNLDPIVNYTVSCSGDITCPPNFTTTDNTRSYIITNLTPMTDYTFSVVATNSIGSGEAGVLNYTTPGKKICQVISSYVCMIDTRIM